MPTIVLHQWRISPFCGKVRRILALKGLDFTTVDYNGLLASKAARLTRTGKLPVMDYDGRRIQDSTDIARFLDERHPDEPLYPDSPADRARAAFWEDWADESLYWFEVYLRFNVPEVLPTVTAMLCEGRSALETKAFSLVVPGMMRRKLTAQGLRRLPRERVEAMFLEHIDRLDVLLADRPWLVGDRMSIADISVVAQLDEVLRTSHLKAQVQARAAVMDLVSRVPAAD